MLRLTPLRSHWFRWSAATLPAILALLSPTLVPVASAASALKIERTYLPDAKPSAFAIGFPNGVNFCYDVVRGGLSYVWTGGFLDLAPVRPGEGKNILPAGLLGPVIYRETGDAPLRRGDAARVPYVEFQGYRLGTDSIEFQYTVDGATVRETIRLRTDGQALIRHFRVDAPPDRFWYLPGPRQGATLQASGGVEDAGGYRFATGLRGELTLEISLPPPLDEKARPRRPSFPRAGRRARRIPD